MKALEERTPQFTLTIGRDTVVLSRAGGRGRKYINPSHHQFLTSKHVHRLKLRALESILLPHTRRLRLRSNGEMLAALAIGGGGAARMSEPRVTEIKLYFTAFPRELPLVNPPPLRSTPSAWLLGNFTIKLSSHAPSSSMLLPSPFVTLLGDFTTLKLSSCAPSRSKPSGLLLSISQAVCPRNPSHPDCCPQALKLCALELQTFPLLPSISSAILPPSSSHAVRSRASCCYLHPCVTLLGDFTTLKLSSCAPSKSKPSRLLPSSPQAVCSRASELLIATFDLLGDFAFKLCALELHAVRIATFDLSLGNFTTLRAPKLSRPTPSSSKPSMLSLLSFPANPPPSRFQVLCIATPLSSF
jgi:hypothetical protein